MDNASRRRAVFLVLLPALVLPARVPEARPGPGSRGGIVVTGVAPGNAGDRSGLEVGDRLLGWTWQSWGEPGRSRSGELTSPLDLEVLEGALAVEGPVTLSGTRNGRPLEVTVTQGKWAVRARPYLSVAELAALERRSQGGAPDPGVLLELSESLSRKHRQAEAAWLRLEAARSLTRLKRTEEARSALDRALSGGTGTLTPEAGAQLLMEVANIRAHMGDADGAHDLYRHAAERWKGLSPCGGYAAALSFLAEISFRRGDLETAMDGFRKSLSALHPRTSKSYLAARTVSRIGEVFWTRGQLDQAQDYFGRAYALMEAMAPEGAEIVGFANNLGKVRFRKGDTLGAETIFRRSVDILGGTRPGSLELARSLNGLGLILTELGDFPEAERRLSAAVAIWKEEAPGNPSGWRPLSNLGNVHLHRGDLEEAETCYSEVLEMVRQIAPDSLHETSPLGNLAAVSLNRQDHDTAEALLKKVLSITENEAPGSTDLSRRHNSPQPLPAAEKAAGAPRSARPCQA